MKTFQYNENLSVSARAARVIVSTLAGTTLFAVVTVFAIGLATSAIVGWDPVKTAATNLLSLLTHHGADHRSTHA